MKENEELHEVTFLYMIQKGKGYSGGIRASIPVSHIGEPKPFLAVLTKNSVPAVEPKLKLKNG